jgi:hypothetical protein
MYGIISPQDWGLLPAGGKNIQPWLELGIAADEWEERARKATYEWLLRNWQEERGAFAGHCRVGEGCYEAPQLTNLIAPWQFMAAYDRYGDGELLHKAACAAHWMYHNMVETHPMSVVVGGVRDSWCPDEVWTKFTAEFIILNLGLYTRTREGEFMRRAMQSARFLMQAELHDHATKFNVKKQEWDTRGWQSFGRIIEAYLYLYEVTEDYRWLGRALAWGEYSLTLQAPDSAFYLINGEYYNTDLAADELRALTFLHEQTKLPQFLTAAQRFGDWHLQMQRPDGAWLLTVDRFSNPVSEYVGPGDVPNISVSLLRLHRATGEPRYLTSSLKAMRYALSQQVVPGCEHPFADSENALWGYWSWDPYYDYTMSGDQVTHFARGLWFTIDYLASLAPEQTKALAAAARDDLWGEQRSAMCDRL